jgi:hypothetical protein
MAQTISALRPVTTLGKGEIDELVKVSFSEAMMLSED